MSWRMVFLLFMGPTRLPRRKRPHNAISWPIQSMRNGDADRRIARVTTIRSLCSYARYALSSLTPEYRYRE
jgi:hypothetical protein